jgi:type IV pilus assembly protein PilB
MNFVNFLLENGIITQDQFDTVKKELGNGEMSVHDALTNAGLNDSQIMEAKGNFMNVPVRNLDSASVPFEILEHIPEESAQHYKFAPIGVKDGFLEVGMVDPGDLEAKDALNFITSKTDMPFKIFLISEKDFEQILDSYQGISGEVTKALSELETTMTSEDESIDADNTKKTKEGAMIIEDAPVTKIVATILKYAVEGKASDVHIEPMREKVRVRFRVDGTLNLSLVLPAKVQSAVVARVKILSKMKLDEKRKPQDGRFSATVDGRRIDFRVSTFPSYHGEKIVMRILDQERGVKSIDELGLSDINLKMLKKAVKRPYGLILVSGPTGSGKSTTLYSVLKEVDTDKHNVLSLEDPVEYNVNGVSQSQVRADIGYTFANGLRTTLRQDPDIIMVGEIRDGETAKLAIQASLTGHLVLSTIHTNTAAGIVPRLIDMGVDPYLIPPTLILGMAQRLVKTICPNSGEPITIEGSLKEMIESGFSDLPEKFKDRIPTATEMLKIKGSAECPTGTSGRQAVFEMYEMDKNIEQTILHNPIESAIYDAARLKGMITMKEDAIIKAMNKEIPFEEIATLG